MQAAEGENWTVFQGDSRLTDLSALAASALVTDPPYGINVAGKRGQVGGAVAARNTVYETEYAETVYGDAEPFDPRPLLSLGRDENASGGRLSLAPVVVLWGANHFADKLPPSPSWLVWDKRRGVCSNKFADCELAWTNAGGPARLYSSLWLGMLRDEEKGEHYHPTQKPVSLMRWTLKQLNLPKGATVLDPYCGSGSTGVAALQLGYRFIGVEIEPLYFRTATERLRRFEDEEETDLFPEN